MTGGSAYGAPATRDLSIRPERVQPGSLEATMMKFIWKLEIPDQKIHVKCGTEFENMLDALQAGWEQAQQYITLDTLNTSIILIVDSLVTNSTFAQLEIIPHYWV